MEQRIGSSSSKPLEGAGFDPAFIPGLTAPATGREEEAEDTKDAPGTDEDVAVDDTAAVADPEAEKSDDSPAAGDDEPEPAPDGPAFEASDRRAALVADHRGVRLKLDDQECEFRWDEIGAVETETARFGKRFTVTVHTPDRRWYPIEIEADSRRRFAEWDAALDKVLDAYFDDGAEAAADKDDAEDEVEAETADRV
ncbi:hypothetical protein ACH4UX_25940 [Streptomyces althioticus]|uniref:Uncharacterized protein n=1 Tax=Streptomyces griseorubens TaxID=66897 RepID=A0ABR4SYL6_9ACTN|nr:hypothetical protein [Streptomyces griseorubens]KEG40282.1 hypothetical protein DJ64_10030 [Streptomyces griseorubens]